MQLREDMSVMEQNDQTRWEYETRTPPRGETQKESEDPKAALNELAAEGWRFVETIDYTGGGTKYLVFERARRTEDGGDDDP